MIYRLLADAVLIVHLAFILFVIAGAVLVAWRRALLLPHLAAVAWGAGIELTGAVCPLTYLEVDLRALAGQAGYQGGFIDHYLLPLIYPAGLGPELQWWLAGGVIAVNALLYAWIGRRLLRTRRPRAANDTRY